MAENKKILLYRIDKQAKNVIFVVIEDDERLWGNISEDMQTILSFDEIFRDITKFRDCFLDYEQLTDELIGAINGRGEVFRTILARFDDNRLNSFNFFTRYYSDTLRGIFLSARQEIDKAGAFFNTRALKKSTEYVNEVFNNIDIDLGEDGETKETFMRFLRNGKSVGSSEAVHGFSDEFLRENGEPPQKVLTDFLDFLRGAMIVGHNVTYDISILTCQFQQCVSELFSASNHFGI